MKTKLFVGLAFIVLITMLFVGAVQSKELSYSEINIFSDNAIVRYYYSEECHFCNEQKIVLKQLADQGYKLKPMDVTVVGWSDLQSLPRAGTPTFISENGDYLIGKQDYFSLKNFLDDHK